MSHTAPDGKPATYGEKQENIPEDTDICDRCHEYPCKCDKGEKL